MRIEKYFRTKEEYIKYVFDLVTTDCNASLWREEDLPKLQPFFEACQSGKYDNFEKYTHDQVMESMEFYQKCLKEYANEKKDIQDSIKGFSTDEFLCRFFVYWDESDADEWRIEDLKTCEWLEFPLYAIGDIESGFDRSGDVKYFAVELIPETKLVNMKGDYERKHS